MRSFPGRAGVMAWRSAAECTKTKHLRWARVGFVAILMVGVIACWMTPLLAQDAKLKWRQTSQPTGTVKSNITLPELSTHIIPASVTGRNDRAVKHAVAEDAAPPQMLDTAASRPAVETQPTAKSVVIRPGAHTTQPQSVNVSANKNGQPTRTITNPSPFDDNFREVSQMRQSEGRSDTNTPQSIMRQPAGGSAFNQPEEIPPGSMTHSHGEIANEEGTFLPTNSGAEWEAAIHGNGDYDGYGCNSCGGDGCSQCYGPRHPRLNYLRNAIRSLLLCAVGGCDPCDDGTFGCGPVPPCCWERDLLFFGGVQGFKGPLDQGRNGNFGFQQGINWGAPLWDAAGIGFQLGGSATQTNLNESESFSQDRQQYFITAGAFRRQMDCCGWQYGAVYDQLFDHFTQNLDLGQIRGELSYLWNGNEFGFWCAHNVRTDLPEAGSQNAFRMFETADQYAFFLRQRIFGNGSARLWAGFTGESDLIYGGDFRVPMTEALSLQASANYLSPNDNTGSNNEGWNVGFAIVWHFGACSTTAGNSPYNPLFNVADNGTMIVTGRPAINP